jgi:hypothetical protein
MIFILFKKYINLITLGYDLYLGTSLLEFKQKSKNLLIF